jgi:hypothetical protein
MHPERRPMAIARSMIARRFSRDIFIRPDFHE